MSSEPEPVGLPALANQVTQVLNILMRDGREDGKPYSADVSCAINWCKHNNVTVEGDGEEEMSELRSRVGDALGKRRESGLPPLDMESDDEATR